MSAQLPYAGFAPLRPGRIHLYCGSCGRKQSNMRRTKYDPKRAVLMNVACDRCDAGCKDPLVQYLAADGSRVPWDEDEVYP